MPDDPSGVNVSRASSREWEDPKIVQAGEVAKYMDEGWEPLNAVVVPATNNETGERTAVVAYCIRRKFSPVRNILEGRRVQGARTVVNLPRLGSR